VLSKRERLAELLDASGALSMALALRSVASLPWLTVLTYHRVNPSTAGGELDADVIDATPQQFDRQLALLASRFRFVGLDDVLAFTRGRPLPPNPVLITFDDGYRDTYSHALPILKRHRARAVFFIATWYLERRRMFWWDRIATMLARSQHDHVELSYPRRMSLQLRGDRSSAARLLLDLVKTWHDLDVDRFLDGLAERCGSGWSDDEERQTADRLLLSWDEVRALSDAGMDVASHTRTHRVLQTLPDRSLREELRGSRLDLEAQLDRPVESIAYPVGYAVTDRRVRAAIKESGYQLGFSNMTGVNHTVGRGDPYNIRRIAMSAHHPESFFRAMMALPYLAYKNGAPAGGAFAPGILRA
jgi:peptidoglycan/xylan/chitin deacetylase (PgdA/CDA1 family)